MSSELPSNEILLQQLGWRYAVRKFDPTRRLSEEDWQILEQTLILTPTSFGLQPYKFFVITDPQTKADLLPHAWNQPQIKDCSHLVIIAGRTVFTDDDVDRYIELVMQIRNVSRESQEDYARSLKNVTQQLTEDNLIQEWAMRQAYIALGFLLSVAAMRGIDACPMEGFVPAGIDKVLNLSAQNLTASVLCTLGYRAADDWLGALPKVRLPREELVKHI